jgi:hypothetical protein
VTKRCRVAVALVGAIELLAATASAATAGATPLRASALANPLTNPAANRQPPAFSIETGTCSPPPGAPSSGPSKSWVCQSPCLPHYDDFAFNGSSPCTDLLLASINEAQGAEHLNGFTLPSNFAELTVPEQMFVLVNLERISRGVPPLVGLSPYLGPPAETAARDAQDPTFKPVYGRVQVWYPPSGGMYGFGGAWSGNQVNALAAMFGWMYDDGWAGKGATKNIACGGPTSSGCWGHRDELLGEYTGTMCSDCIAGGGYASPAANNWAESYVLLLVHPVQFPTPLEFTWDSNVLPNLPQGWERTRAA